ncbi:MAG: hypothetical protein AVDCRST_MAG49-4543, partial [uncultured Thermomicrobiales bacterium]
CLSPVLVVPTLPAANHRPRRPPGGVTRSDGGKRRVAVLVRLLRCGAWPLGVDCSAG